VLDRFQALPPEEFRARTSVKIRRARRSLSRTVAEVRPKASLISGLSKRCRGNLAPFVEGPPDVVGRVAVVPRNCAQSPPVWIGDNCLMVDIRRAVPALLLVLPRLSDRLSKVPNRAVRRVKTDRPRPLVECCSWRIEKRRMIPPLATTLCWVLELSAVFKLGFPEKKSRTSPRKPMNRNSR
jgi:hypothetical protein